MILKSIEQMVEHHSMEEGKISQNHQEDTGSVKLCSTSIIKRGYESKMTVTPTLEILS